MVNPCSRWGGAGRRIPQSRVTAQSRRAQGRGATGVYERTSSLDPNEAAICREAEAGRSQYIQGEPYMSC